MAPQEAPPHPRQRDATGMANRSPEKMPHVTSSAAIAPGCLSAQQGGGERHRERQMGGSGEKYRNTLQPAASLRQQSRHRGSGATGGLTQAGAGSSQDTTREGSASEPEPAGYVDAYSKRCCCRSTDYNLRLMNVLILCTQGWRWSRLVINMVLVKY